MSGTLPVLTSFLASAVEAVEALTIVLAVGITRGWWTSLTSVFLALLALAVVVAALGPAPTRYVSLDTLRVLVGDVAVRFLWGGSPWRWAVPALAQVLLPLAAVVTLVVSLRRAS